MDKMAVHFIIYKNKYPLRLADSMELHATCLFTLICPALSISTVVSFYKGTTLAKLCAREYMFILLNLDYNIFVDASDATHAAFRI